jgi:hypothetical protein
LTSLLTAPHIKIGVRPVHARLNFGPRLASGPATRRVNGQVGQHHMSTDGTDRSQTQRENTDDRGEGYGELSGDGSLISRRT